MTSMFIRCSAWFGSVRFGFLTPEIFIRQCLCVLKNENNRELVFERKPKVKVRVVWVILAERLSSAMNVLGAECAARSTIRDKHVHSL